MAIPDWIKRHRSVYLPARAAALSLLGPERFYTPFSAASLCRVENGALLDELLHEIRLIGREDRLSIWSTPSGEIATMESEIPEHVAFLIDEFSSTPYFSDPADVGLGKIVLDVGANIGMFARQAVAAGAAGVVCLEPSPETARALRRNLAAWRSEGRVCVLEKGAWDCATILRMTVDPKRPGRSSCVDLPPEATAYEAPIAVDTIDRIIRDLELPRVDFIKMDVEGAECKALAGAVETLRRFRPQLAIAVEHTARPLKNAGSVRDLVTGFKLGYRCSAGRFTVDSGRRLAPEILYFR